jgi:hypothetical protein
MTIGKLSTILMFALGASLVCACESYAADEASIVSTRGTVKVQPRFFNPFAVEESRLSLDPFGIFTLTEPAAASTANPFAIGGGSAATTTTAATTTAQSQSAVVTTPPPATTLTLSPLLVRPPFRPADRSPYRPPPRPPFPP